MLLLAKDLSISLPSAFRGWAEKALTLIDSARQAGIAVSYPVGSITKQ